MFKGALRRFAVLGFLPMAWACETMPTEPAVDASAYLFDLEVDMGPEIKDFDPDVSKGGGSGLLRGAGIGAGGCIVSGAYLDAASGGATLFLGTAMGIMVSPACALLGGIAGSGIAESEEDVLSRTENLNSAAEELGYPDKLAVELRKRLAAQPVYAIAGEDNVKVHSLAYATTPLALEESVQPTNETEETAPDAIGNVRLDETGPAVIGTVVSEIPLLRPQDSNGSIHVEVTSYGFTGAGVDPKLPLNLTARLCVTDYATGRALVAGKFSSSSAAHKLEDWAERDHQDLEDMTLRLVDNVATQMQTAMGRQVRLNHKVSCK